MELKCTLQGKYININHSKLNTSITIKCACLYVIFSTTASDAITCCPVIQVFRERFCPFLPKLRAKMPFLKVMRHAPLPSWEKHYRQTVQMLCNPTGSIKPESVHKA